ncbi:MAG: GyrI-like domain-containing protein [Candidatus Pacearchaeota archaeon]|nr:GyrI-like domain-containing protein [Candidatus Pacearchaeota archaeon]
MKKKSSYLIFIIIIFFLVLYYLGVISQIKIAEENSGPFKVIYKNYIGDYGDISNIHTEISEALKSNGINTTKSFGIYYDNPDEVEKSQLRSEVGFILNDEEYDELKSIQIDYNLKIIPISKNIVIHFPYRGKISILIATFKVYPKLNNYIEEKGYTSSPIMEIYDSKNQEIIYMMEI